MSTLYQLISDSDDGTNLHTFYVEEERTAFAREQIAPEWAEVFPDEPLPDDLEEAARELNLMGWDVYFQWCDTRTQSPAVAGDDAIIEAARDIWDCDDLEVDEGAKVVRTDEGNAWVAAWVYVNLQDEESDADNAIRAERGTITEVKAATVRKLGKVPYIVQCRVRHQDRLQQVGIFHATTELHAIQAAARLLLRGDCNAVELIATKQTQEIKP